jgi:hypothetical protein
MAQLRLEICDVKQLNFSIDPLARLSTSAKAVRSTRALLWPKKPEQQPQLAPRPASIDFKSRYGVAAGMTNALFSHNATRAREELQEALTCKSNAISHANQLIYGAYRISTTRRLNGTWVADFGRLDGKLLEIHGVQRAVLETAPYKAEALAIADAKIEIDERDAKTPER